MKNKKRSTGDILTGTGRENIPNTSFRIMSFIMKLMDVLGNYSNKNFKTLGLQKGQVVVDYGCGPARYIKKASQAVGSSGKVFAVDIHPMAIDNVNRKIEKYGLQNVKAVQSSGYSCPIADNTADVVYALDMFHMIEHPAELIKELARIVTFHGIIIIEDGHQPRSQTLQKIEDSGILCIFSQNRHHVVCKLKETKCLA